MMNSIAGGDFYIPTTMSAEARAAARMFTLTLRDMQTPLPTDIEGWEKIWAFREDYFKDMNREIVKTLGTSVKEIKMGGVPALDVRPKAWKDNRKAIIYTHGGGYTFNSAASTLIGSAPVADATGLRVISVDYTVAPKAKWREVTNQVSSVIKALVEEGYNLKDIAIYGESAGGALAVGSVLKARDEGLGLMGAVVLWSPWADITDTGDTYTTLKGADPVLNYEKTLRHAADAYADPADQRHPYVSPVYGDYTKGFPPTLIQVGTAEIFLSNAVRQYQVMDQAGISVKLDPYEGMWHAFQKSNWNIPEAQIARQKMVSFLHNQLGY